MKKSVTHCSYMIKKNRRPSDLAESLNAALGFDDYRQVIVSCLVSPTALFATFTAHHDKHTELHYTMVTGLFVSRMTLNFELLRNAPVAYLGRLSFLNVNGEVVTILLPESPQED